MPETDVRGDRGQLIVIIALVLGLVFVLLAVVVNSAVFAENLATRETVDSQRATAFTAEMDPAIADRYDRTNDNGSHTVDAARDMFDDSLDAWVDQRSDVAAEEGGLFRATWTTHAGWRLRQTDSGPFTPADDTGEETWTLATDATNVSTFDLDVTRNSLHDGASTDAFHVVVDDGSTTWELYLYHDESTDDIVLAEDDPSSPPADCHRAASEAVINIRNGTVAGTDCSALDPPTLDGPLTVKFVNVLNSTGGAPQVEGTYNVTVNGSGAVDTSGGDPVRFDHPGDGQPSAAAIIYAVDYEATYDGGEVDHERDARFAPRPELR